MKHVNEIGLYHRLDLAALHTMPCRRIKAFGDYIVKYDIWVGFPRKGVLPVLCHFKKNFVGPLWPNLICYAHFLMFWGVHNWGCLFKKSCSPEEKSEKRDLANQDWPGPSNIFFKRHKTGKNAILGKPTSLYDIRLVACW